MANKKETTIDELATMVQKGFVEITEKMDKGFERLDKDNKLIRQDIEDVKLRLDNVAYRFEMKEMEERFEKRFKMLELKIGLKHN